MERKYNREVFLCQGKLFCQENGKGSFYGYYTGGFYAAYPPSTATPSATDANNQYNRLHTSDDIRFFNNPDNEACSSATILYF